MIEFFTHRLLNISLFFFGLNFQTNNINNQRNEWNSLVFSLKAKFHYKLKRHKHTQRNIFLLPLLLTKHFIEFLPLWKTLWNEFDISFVVVLIEMIYLFIIYGFVYSIDFSSILLLLTECYLCVCV